MFPYCCFQDYFFILSFHSIDYSVSWHRFLLQIFGLLFAQLLKSVGLCHLPNLGKVSAIIYFLEYFFSATISVFLLALKWHKCLSFVIIPQVPKALSMFFSLHYLCCRLGNFCCCLQLSLICSLVTSILRLSLSTKFLLKFQLFHFSVVKFLSGFSLYLLFIFWCFLFIIFTFVHKCSLKCFDDGCFKIIII